jgi:hypothetical protein
MGLTAEFDRPRFGTSKISQESVMKTALKLICVVVLVPAALLPSLIALQVQLHAVH